MASIVARTQRSFETASFDPSSMFSPSSSASSAVEAGFLPYREVHTHPCARLLVATLTVLETAAVVPTLWLEQRLGHAIEQIVLRVALMLLRLYPIWRVLSICLYYCAFSRCMAMLPFPFQWRCRQWFQSDSCSRLPEMRWGAVVTLDLWFLLTTHLIGAEGPLATISVAFLIVNSLLCILDILALVILLIHSKQNAAEVYPEVTFQRPKEIKWRISEAAGTEGTHSTCAICLSEFGEGESVQLLPCGHVFHTDCITHWLQVSHHCPMRCPELVLPPRFEFGATMPPGQLHESGRAESIVTQYDGPLLESGQGTEMDVIPELLVLPGQVPRSSGS